MLVTQALARNMKSLFAADMPKAAMEKAKVAILDTVGVTIAGSCHPGFAILRDVIMPTAAAGPSLVYGSNIRLNTLDAAQLNGMSAHMLDYDDSNSFLHGHPSVAILPGLLSVAEEVGASGADVVRAYIVGFETAVRVGMGISRRQYTHGFHPTSTVGIFANVAACAVLLRLSEAQIATALGIAASMSSGIKSNFGSMTKPLHVGQAARNGLLAVRLARQGFTSGPTAFEHPQGYLNVYDGGPEHYDVPKMLSGWGDDLALVEHGMKQKRFPVCYACLPPIDGVLDIVAREKITPDTVQSLHVAVHPIRFPHINNPDPQTALAAKFSVFYCVARALIAGRLDIEDFEGAAQQDPMTRQLMRRVSFSAYDHDNIGGAEVTVTTTDGRVLTSKIEAALGGSNSHALSMETVKAKFEDCAGRALTARQTHEVYEALRALDTLPGLADLTRLMVVPERHAAVA